MKNLVECHVPDSKLCTDSIFLNNCNHSIIPNFKMEKKRLGYDYIT